jgi:hypothetical protein
MFDHSVMRAAMIAVLSPNQTAMEKMKDVKKAPQ